MASPPNNAKVVRLNVLTVIEPIKATGARLKRQTLSSGQRVRATVLTLAPMKRTLRLVACSWHARFSCKLPRPPVGGAGAVCQSASGSGRIWKCTAMGVMPLPPS